MIRTYYAYLMFALYLLVSLIPFIWYKVLGLVNKDKQYDFLHKAVAKWGRAMVKLTGSSVEVVGSEKLPDGHVLYVGNHQSNFDIPLLLGHLPKHKAFVAKIELSKIPVLSLWMRQMGCLFLDRGNLKQSLRTILKGIDQLKSGETLVIFPEGTRSKNHTLGEFKKGSLKLGIKANVPIVPITTIGSFLMFEEKNAVSKEQVKIIIHDPIYPDQLSKEDAAVLSGTVRNIILDPIKDLQ